ncbi:1-deoxy-D-xylulose-5-phosphate reductoisomerase [Capsulimonas corticalis]|uniref:1-deoxy-D-xylulose-5-phosphate reductoisomerase n=1 Tax=Capsulimonas corticalis TaxID=2219043 RepID=UPI000E648872
MKKLVILGSTGSIGTQTLDIVRRLPERLQIVALSGHRNVELLKQQADEFGVSPEWIECGDEANLERLATHPDADIVVVSVAGAVGTRATVAALRRGKDIALATKEVLVAAGEIVTRTARESGARLLPIDSEHSAIFQCLQGAPDNSVAKILLTASGGPFREWTKERMESVSIVDALNHPTWPSMGRKITIDSATLMNKGLETIEARWLFDIPMEQVEVVIHPQSVVHSLVEYHDGAVIAQLGLPDMRLPIQYALLYPERVDSGLPRMDMTQLAKPLTFEAPDTNRFPSLRLARDAGAAGGALPAVLNAANEAAVAQFLDAKITFPAIMTLVERTMHAHRPLENPDLDQIAAADQWARLTVTQLINEDPSLQWNGAAER